MSNTEKTITIRHIVRCSKALEFLEQARQQLLLVGAPSVHPIPDDIEAICERITAATERMIP